MSNGHSLRAWLCEYICNCPSHRVSKPLDNNNALIKN